MSTDDRHRRVGRSLGAGALALLGIVWVGSEAAHWLAHSGPRSTEPQACVVLVLGYPSNADGSASEVQRWRVAVGVRALRTAGCDLLLLSGGPVRNGHVEARTMARLARDEGVDSALLEIEEHASNTWENVQYTLDTLRTRPHILIASNPLHARRARRYLCRQAPELCGRATVATGYEPLARPFWKVGTTLYELRALIRDWLFYE